MNKIHLLAGLVLSTPLYVNATIISGYGANADATTASNCPSFCTTANGGDFQSDSAGGEFTSPALATQNSYATAQAYAALSGATYLPVLRVNTEAGLGRGGFATAFGVQGFTYSGASSTTETLNFNLHGSVGNGSGGYSSNVLSAKVAVLIGNDLPWYPSFGTLVYEVGSGLEQAGIRNLFITSGIDVNRADSITFDINPGEDFYVVASMTASSNNGYADGWNTLTMQFDDDTGLTAAGVNAASIPVPATVGLLGLGLMGLMGMAKRKPR